MINLVCDRALLGGYGARTARITPQIVAIAAETLDLATPGVPAIQWVRRRATSFAAGVALTAMTAAAVWYGVVTLQARGAVRQARSGRPNVAHGGASATVSEAGGSSPGRLTIAATDCHHRGADPRRPVARPSGK